MVGEERKGRRKKVADRLGDVLYTLFVSGRIGVQCGKCLGAGRPFFLSFFLSFLLVSFLFFSWSVGILQSTDTVLSVLVSVR